MARTLQKTARMNGVSRSLALLATAGITLILQASCARSVSSDVDPATPSFAGDAKPNSVCIPTTCPSPWATCRDGGLCTTDTSRDVDNCGECGKACPRPSQAFHALSLCDDGKCVYACAALTADCNHDDADGCEVLTSDDPHNCGGCGVACAEGELCWHGACGCPEGFTRCGTECRDLSSDQSCGSCDTRCAPPKSDDPEWKCGPDAQPANSTWACQSGACKLACARSFGDCDTNLCSNGCEVDKRTDRMNCGACGNVCSPQQDCVDGACLCPPGTTRCGKRCVDLNVDPNNCGECDNGCPGAGGESDNGSPLCNGGRCGYVCFPGFKDCNRRVSDGCEVNLGNDPLHCGSCETRCEVARSQPCVAGQCLTKPCEPGAVPF